MKDEFLTVRQVCKITKRGQAAVWQWVRLGKIPAQKLGPSKTAPLLIKRSDLNNFLRPKIVESNMLNIPI